ncbi:tetratricopeptide repeat protein [Cytophagaceae bacterium ABcell3]|nr:tetratricopeptide repeat protein [Cytophagaceae bacterium ABcell3]
MTNNPQKVKTSEKVQNTETLQDTFSQSEEFLSKYRNLILGAIGLVVLAVAGVIFYNHNNEQQNAEAQQAMFPAVFYFEADSLERALHGNERSPGLLNIATDYSNTKAGNLANFYAGVIFMRQNQFDDAIKHLKQFSSEDLLLQARAYSLIGDAYMEQENFEQAVSYYKKAADYKPNEQFTPNYIMKAALAFELKNDFSSAVGMYDRIISKYPRSQEFNDAKKLKARAETLASNQ